MNYVLTCFFCLIMISATQSNVWAQQRPQTGEQSVTQLKQSPAGSKIILLIEGINENRRIDEAYIKKLFSKRLIGKMGVAGLKDLLVKEIRHVDGHLDVHRADRTGMMSYDLYVISEMNNEWLKMSLKFDGRDNPRIEELTLDVMPATHNLERREPPLNHQWK